MTKAELIDTIARSTDQPKKQVASTLDLAFEQIARAIRKDKRFWVPGFGTFSVRQKGRRVGRNPKTGQEVPIMPRRVLVFRPSHVLKARVNGTVPGPDDDE